MLISSLSRILELTLTLGICSIFIFRPLISGLVYPQSNYIFLSGLICLWYLYLVILLLKSENKLILPRRFIWLTILFVLNGIASSYYGFNRYESVQFGCNFLTYVLLFLLIYSAVRLDWQVRWIWWSLIFGAALVGLFGVYQYYWGLTDTRQFFEVYIQPRNVSESFISRLYSDRIFSTFIYPNALAGYMLFVLPIVGTGFYFKNLLTRWQRLSLPVVLGVVSIFFIMNQDHLNAVVVAVLGSIFYPLTIVFSLFLTYSKAGLLIVTIGRLIFYWLFLKSNYTHWNLRKKWGLILTIEMIIWIFVSIFFSSQWHKFFTSSMRRSEYWVSCWNMFLDHPWLGVGWGAFGSVFSLYKLPGGEETRYAHNNYFQVFCELGIVGGIVFVLLWIWLWKAWMKSPNRMPAIIVLFSLSFYLAHSFFDFNWYDPSISLIVWGLLGTIGYYGATESYSVSLYDTKRMYQLGFILIIFTISVGILLLAKNISLSIVLKKTAQQYETQGRLESAIEIYEKARDLCSFDPELSYSLGMGYSKLGHLEQARKCLERTIDLVPTSSGAMAVLADLLEHDGKTSEAEEYLRKSIQNYPANHFYYNKLGHFLENHGRIQEALVQYSLAKDLQDKE